ncbi:YfbM family protein [Sphingobacterium faecale]|uniref:YfbM family protein n=1 Tax=Sphingobacterium faecale TaxID=2803775 RepID=A0ABS1QZ39_9SPHI|nr:YfbM family protein [Sphingobacterium faecale]MBL1407701.1 YfbM family protein [Sphingobacterium faecale]
MGMIAGYLMVDEATLDGLMDLKNEDLANRIFEIEESGESECMDIDKLWDALHFFLTGVSAADPIEENKRSEAIVGVHGFNLDDEEADFIACVEQDELHGIIDALEKIDFESLSKKFTPSDMEPHEVYPNGIWQEDKALLLAEFKQALAELLAFYRKAVAMHRHVIVSIL